jgi:hypothetical protein
MTPPTNISHHCKAQLTTHGHADNQPRTWCLHTEDTKLVCSNKHATPSEQIEAILRCIIGNTTIPHRMAGGHGTVATSRRSYAGCSAKTCAVPPQTLQHCRRKQMPPSTQRVKTVNARMLTQHGRIQRGSKPSPGSAKRCNTFPQQVR